MERRLVYVVLPAVKDDTLEFEAIERRIIRLFRRAIYAPLMKAFTTQTLKNSNDALLDALRTGRITFNRGTFSGDFNATISKQLKALGAKWSRDDKAWRISRAALPIEVQVGISASGLQFERKLQTIDRKLAAIVPEQMAAELETKDLFDRALWKTDKKLASTLKAVSVPVRMSPEQAKRLSEEWQTNIDLWITDFTEREITALRKQIKASVLAGNRYETAVKTIKKSFGVTEKKAKFLARQETMLMTTKLKQIRYEEAGVNHYKWKCVTGTPAHPVRPFHRALNDRSQKGELFRFDKPPIDGPHGERHNPGENYNCRCTAIPVVKF